MRYILFLLLLVSHSSFAQSLPDSSRFYASDSQLPQSDLLENQDESKRQTLKRTLLLVNQPALDTNYTHSSWHAQFKARNFIVPGLLLGYGIASMGNHPMLGSNDYVHTQLQNQFPTFETKIDNYTRYVPLAAVYGLNLAGVKGKNNLVNMSLIYVLSSYINSTLSKNLKNVFKENRPDNSGDDAFPSAHTSSAFSKAELMHQEFGGRSIWYSVGGYSFATATGALRMLNNKHWLSDVLAGAGIGILSTKVAYAIYPFLQERVLRSYPGLAVVPMYDNGAVGLSLGYSIKERKNKPRKL